MHLASTKQAYHLDQKSCTHIFPDTMSKDCHILPVEVHPLFCSRGRCPECTGMLQAANYSQVFLIIQ